LTDTGIYRREMQVLTTCVAAGYPVASVIGGGYADDLNALITDTQYSTVPPVKSIASTIFNANYWQKNYLVLLDTFFTCSAFRTSTSYSTQLRKNRASIKRLRN
jgi:hypothetical protein